MTSATLEEATSAKAKLAVMLKGLPELSAIGIAILDGGGLGVKVNLLRRTDHRIPEEIEGVPVVIEVTGGISPL